VGHRWIPVGLGACLVGGTCLGGGEVWGLAPRIHLRGRPS
jgi:hypothetical protein